MCVVSMLGVVYDVNEIVPVVDGDDEVAEGGIGDEAGDFDSQRARDGGGVDGGHAADKLLHLGKLEGDCFGLQDVLHVAVDPAYTDTVVTVDVSDLPRSLGGDEGGRGSRIHDEEFGGGRCRSWSGR